MSALGIDISSNNGQHIDFKGIRRAGYRYVLIKVSQGTSYVNPYAKEHTAQAKDEGLIPGGYAFVSPVSAHSGAVEADYFVSHAHDFGLLRKGCLRPTGDIEVTKLGPGRPSRRYDYGFVSALSRWLGPGSFRTFDGKPFIYTGSWFWDGVLGARNSHDCPLWLAAYTKSYKNYIPKGFLKGVSIHQFTDKGVIPGVAGKFDLDRYLGKNLTALQHRHTLLKSI